MLVANQVKKIVSNQVLNRKVCAYSLNSNLNIWDEMTSTNS